MSADDRESFWQSVAFYNYVQDFVGTGPRERPTPRQFESSWPPFAEILAELQPDVIVILGFGLWDALDTLLPPRSALDISSYGSRAGFFVKLAEANPGAGIAGYLKHPSTGFRPDDWRPSIRALMDVARASR